MGTLIIIDTIIIYGVATISRMLKNIGLLCKRDLQKRPIFCKETYIFKHPTHRSHPIVDTIIIIVSRRNYYGLATINRLLKIMGLWVSFIFENRVISYSHVN